MEEETLTIEQPPQQTLTSESEIALFREKIKDRKWRLNNLYYVKDEDGNMVKFEMRPIQEYLHDNLWFFNIIPKARQLGMTTFFCILYLDQVLFNKNKTALIIAHRQEDMKKIFQNKIRFAWDNLHPWLKSIIGEAETDSANELRFPNGSSISVSMSSRSGTVNYLHISEFGYICQKYPEKAKEIVTGSINSVHPKEGSVNMISIESTAAGREGYFYDFCMEADKNKKMGKELSVMDWKLFFFPWWIDEKYSLDDSTLVDGEAEKYFKSLETKYQILLSEGQKRWWVKKKKLNGENMFAEYPSTLDEAFSVSVEGAYYSSQMTKVYEQGRIQTLPVVEGIPVDTYWDLGINDMMIILFVQTVGATIRFVDVYFNNGEGLDHYAKVLQDKKYRYGRHNFPWDIEVKDLSTGKTRKNKLYELGFLNVFVAPKLSIADGIERVRSLFSRFLFDEVKTKKLYDALGNYRKDFDEKLGVFKDSPRHDENSHWCFGPNQLIETKKGFKKISEITPGEYVRDLTGWTRVLDSGVTGVSDTYNFSGIEMTLNHPVLTQNGFVSLDAVRYYDKIVLWNKKEKSLQWMDLILFNTQNQNIEKIGFILKVMQRYLEVTRRLPSTDIYGKKQTIKKFLKDTLFITKMVIRLIMNYRTWSVYQLLPTKKITQTNQKELLKVELPLELQESMQVFGMGPQKGLSFIVNWLKSLGKSVKSLINTVCFARKNIVPIYQRNQNSVVIPVNKKTDVYNLKTESGMFIVNGLVVSNCDAVRVLALTWQGETNMGVDDSDIHDDSNDQSFFG